MSSIFKVISYLFIACIMNKVSADMIESNLYRLDSSKLNAVDNLIESDIENGFPGAELIVVQNGQVIKNSVYGYTNRYDRNGKILANAQLISQNTLFDLASNTKMYATNYAIMHLVYGGKLDIDKPIRAYIPEYTGCDNNGECRDTRTVRDLLVHSAGYIADPQFFMPSKMIGKYAGLYSQESMLTKNNIITKLPFAYSRESKPVYSDVDFMLLGIIVERLTNMSLDKYVEKTFYKPLKLQHTVFNPLEHGFSESECAATELIGNTRNGKINFPNIRKNTIQCEVHDEKAYYSMAGVSGHAGLFSTGNDLLILTSLMVNNGVYNGMRFWSESIENEFTAASLSDDTYGLGWRRAGETHNYKPFGEYASNLAYGHTGWTGTLTLIDPKYKLTIILLTNKRNTPIVNNEFVGDKFATGQYYPVVNLVYQALVPMVQK